MDCHMEINLVTLAGQKIDGAKDRRTQAEQKQESSSKSTPFNRTFNGGHLFTTTSRMNMVHTDERAVPASEILPDARRVDDHLLRLEYRKIPILTPSRFLEIFAKHS